MYVKSSFHFFIFSSVMSSAWYSAWVVSTALGEMPSAVKYQKRRYQKRSVAWNGLQEILRSFMLMTAFIVLNFSKWRDASQNGVRKSHRKLQKTKISYNKVLYEEWQAMALQELYDFFLWEKLFQCSFIKKMLIIQPIPCHFSLSIHPWNHQKSYGFLMFLGGKWH